MVSFVAVGFLFVTSFVSEVIMKTANDGYYYNPCDDYLELSEETRAAGYNKLTPASDNNLGLDWYRFTGDAGDKMADIDTIGKCLQSPSCGAKYPGILQTSHPDGLAPGEHCQRSVCFAKKDACCYKRMTITIMKCQGFWIYELPPPSVNRARYCGNKVPEKKPECNEKKLLYALNKKNAAKSCQEIKQKRKSAESGIYWINPDGERPIQVYCDQETDGGGWTLVYSYTFTNFKGFRTSSNAITPRPNWPTYGDIPVSTTAPVSETDYNAMDFNLWKKLGQDFMIKSNINHWIACKAGTGSLVEFRQGTLQCQVIKNVASQCHGFVPDQLIFNTAGNPGGMSVGPDLIRSLSNVRLKEYYYFDGNTRTNWPTHDPCGTNALNHLKNVANPHGNIYMRE